jgi:RNA polymerase sigma-70 factor (ECF subfamily)
VQEQEWLVEQFEQSRGRLRGVAYRMLGSAAEAEDAVQESWLRLSRSDSSEIENLGGWLTTVVSRVCLDMLRSRKSRREDSMEEQVQEPVAQHSAGIDPEQEVVLADSVGIALLVVLDRLSPAERLAFVLHDLFAVSFEEIGAIVGRSVMATRQLASRARRRVQGTSPESSASSVAERDLAGQRRLVDSFLAALRAGDVQALVNVLDPEFVLHVDEASMQPGGQREVHGAEVWAREAVVFAKGARWSRAALVDGEIGVIVAPQGKLFRVLCFTVKAGKIAEINVLGDAQTLEELEIGVLQD